MTTTDSTELGDEFDPIEFATQILNTVQTHRSSCARYPEFLVISPEQVGSGLGSENRLNTFYRLIGLPAIRDESLIAATSQERDRNTQLSYISQSWTLNYFGSSSLSGHTTKLKDLEKRDIVSNRKATATDYDRMFREPLPLEASINDQTGRRASLLPPLVDASFPVFPMAKRVAPAFTDGDFLISGGTKRLSRPFMEHLIYMRSKVFSGAETELVDQISQLILTETGDEDLATKLPKQFTKIEAAIVEKFVQAFRQSAGRYAQVKSLALKLMSEVAFEAAPTNNPGQRSIRALSSDPSVEVKTVLGERIRTLQEAKAEQNSFLVSLPIESVNRSDRIKRVEDEIKISNIKPDVFISEFVELLSFERKRIDLDLEEAMAEESMKIMQLEQVKRDLMLYSGEFTNLSIFDILSVLYALFTIDSRFLVGLLNEDAKNRLKSDEFFKTNQTSSSIRTDSSFPGLVDSPASLDESIAALSDQIKVAFKLASSFLTKSEAKGES